MTNVTPLFPRRAFLLFMCIRVEVDNPTEDGAKETCEALVTVGKFASGEESDLWEMAFKEALPQYGGAVLISWKREVSALKPRRVHFDPNMEGGLPWEVASYMSEHVPEAERVQIGQWFALTHKSREC